MRLREYLDRERLSNGEFAKLVGVSDSLVSRWLSGQKRPSLDTLEAIRNATRGAVTAEDFMRRPLRPSSCEGAK